MDGNSEISRDDRARERAGGNPQSGAREGSLADDGRENESLRLNL